jgi:glycosyltransferase involved in cell wall biosynthesis
MRYAWHMQEAYFAARTGLRGKSVDLLLQWLRDWDRRSAATVSHFVAISHTVQERIADCYGRSSVVIYPPVDTDFFYPADVEREDYYLVLSALVPYKRIDLAVNACRRLGRRLVVIGTGTEEQKLRPIGGPSIQFLGWQPSTVARAHLHRCRALLFPGEEDFGIVPVEAQACGCPVIAFGRGGATETVIPCKPNSFNANPTGMFFEEQTIDCLADAILAFEMRAGDFSPDAARRQALRFRRGRFQDELFGYLDHVRGMKKESAGLSAGASLVDFVCP